MLKNPHVNFDDHPSINKQIITFVHELFGHTSYLSLLFKNFFRVLYNIYWYTCNTSSPALVDRRQPIQLSCTCTLFYYHSFRNKTIRIRLFVSPENSTAVPKMTEQVLIPFLEEKLKNHLNIEAFDTPSLKIRSTGTCTRASLICTRSL